MTTTQIHPTSYKDPAGFIFIKNGQAYRQVNSNYQPHYEQLMASGLYQYLVEKKWLISHREIEKDESQKGAYKILFPEQLSFQSYPYEWCFAQWKLAARLTLNIALQSLHHGMILKDATPFNVYFRGTQPIFIDTLSFEKYQPDQPWIAFNQFCQQLLYPLLLMAHLSDFRPLQMAAFPQGITASQLKSWLPNLSHWVVNHWLYVFVPARVQRKNMKSSKTVHVSKKELERNLKQLLSFIKQIKPKQKHSVWNNYYEETILNETYLKAKGQIITEWLKPLDDLNRILDMGCNTGQISRAVSPFAKEVLAFDFDALCIDALMKVSNKESLSNVFPFVADVANPTPALGWNHQEFSSLKERAKAEMVLSLALVHHLRIALNIPLHKVIDQLAEWATRFAIVEFIPKSDEKVEQLLMHRADIFDDYNDFDFQKIIEQKFKIRDKKIVSGSDRLLYFLEKK